MSGSAAAIDRGRSPVATAPSAAGVPSSTLRAVIGSSAVACAVSPLPEKRYSAPTSAVPRRPRDAMPAPSRPADRIRPRPLHRR